MITTLTVSEGGGMLLQQPLVLPQGQLSVDGVFLANVCAALICMYVETTQQAYHRYVQT